MKIGWEALRKQKLDLLKVIDHIENSETNPLNPFANSMTGEEKADAEESLTGILHLIDGIQDEAVEKGEATEKEVFGDLSDEEKSDNVNDKMYNRQDGFLL